MRKDIAGTNLNMAVNLEDQRRQVIYFGSRLEEGGGTASSPSGIISSANRAGKIG